jgi:hypothetical protein
MRAPRVIADFVAQVRKGIRFPVRVRAQCRSDGGFQVRGLEPRGGELRVQRGYLSEEPGDIG